MSDRAAILFFTSFQTQRRYYQISNISGLEEHESNTIQQMHCTTVTYRSCFHKKNSLSSHVFDCSLLHCAHYSVREHYSKTLQKTFLWTAGEEKDLCSGRCMYHAGALTCNSVSTWCANLTIGQKKWS